MTMGIYIPMSIALLLFMSASCTSQSKGNLVLITMASLQYIVKYQASNEGNEHNMYRSDSYIRTQNIFGTPLFLIFSSLSHFLVKPMTLYYTKIKSSKSKSVHIFWIGWLINEKSGCLCLRNSILIYESLWYLWSCSHF